MLSASATDYENFHPPPLFLFLEMTKWWGIIEWSLHFHA